MPNYPSYNFCINMKPHIIVIDFEANCSGKDIKDHEIIEFPALLVDTYSGRIISEFHHYVKLIRHTELSEFIKDLTHITNEQVNNGLEWGECIKEFEKWCRNNNLNCSNSTIVTCGDWDFLTMFPKQNFQTKTKISNYLSKLTSHWTNVKVPYRNLFDTKYIRMDKMLSYLGLELIGHHHSGIDDCRNIHRICQEMLKYGFDLTVPTRSIIYYSSR